jgi:hypothetical protein
MKIRLYTVDGVYRHGVIYNGTLYLIGMPIGFVGECILP